MHPSSSDGNIEHEAMNDNTISSQNEGGMNQSSQAPVNFAQSPAQQNNINSPSNHVPVYSNNVPSSVANSPVVSNQLRENQNYSNAKPSSVNLDSWRPVDPSIPDSIVKSYKRKIIDSGLLEDGCVATTADKLETNVRAHYQQEFAKYQKQREETLLDMSPEDKKIYKAFIQQNPDIDNIQKMPDISKLLSLAKDHFGGSFQENPSNESGSGADSESDNRLFPAMSAQNIERTVTPSANPTEASNITKDVLTRINDIKMKYKDPKQREAYLYTLQTFARSTANSLIQDIEKDEKIEEALKPVLKADVRRELLSIGSLLSLAQTPVKENPNDEKGFSSLADQEHWFSTIGETQQIELENEFGGLPKTINLNEFLRSRKKIDVKYSLLKSFINYIPKAPQVTAYNARSHTGVRPASLKA